MSEYILVAIMVFFILGCEKTDVIMDEEFIGTYNGCFTPNIANGLNSSKASVPAVAEVIMNGGQIEVHCYREGFDITLILDYFHNGNDVSICFIGDYFESMYGHSLGHVTTMPLKGNQWMQHLTNEHEMLGNDHAMQMMQENKVMMGMMMKGEGMQMMKKDSMMQSMMKGGNMMGNMMQMMHKNGMMSEDCMKTCISMMKDKGMNMEQMNDNSSENQDSHNH